MTELLVRVNRIKFKKQHHYNLYLKKNEGDKLNLQHGDLVLINIKKIKTKNIKGVD